MTLRPTAAGDLERLACEYPDLASRFRARAQRLRRGLWKAGNDLAVAP